MHVWSSLVGFSRPSHLSPQGQLARGAVLKILIMFVAEYSSTPLGGRSGVSPWSSPAGMWKQRASGSLNWSIFSNSKVLIVVFK